MSVTEAASLAVSATGVVAGLVTFARARRIGVALAVSVELWTAAGLLRLSADGTWRAVATAGAIILVRKLVGAAVTGA
jgi:hypothetical protein